MYTIKIAKHKHLKTTRSWSSACTFNIVNLQKMHILDCFKKQSVKSHWPLAAILLLLIILDSMQLLDAGLQGSKQIVEIVFKVLRVKLEYTNIMQHSPTGCTKERNMLAQHVAFVCTPCWATGSLSLYCETCKTNAV